MKRKALLILLLFPLLINYSYSQKTEKDSLEYLVNNFTQKDSTLVKNLNRVSFLLVNSDLYSSKKYVERAIKTANEIGYHQGKAIGLTILGLVYYRIGLFDKAMEIQMEALYLSEKMDFKQQIAWVYNNLGNIYTKQRKYDEAVLNYQKSLLVKEMLSDRDGIATTYKNISYLNFEKKNYDTSMHYAQKGLHLASLENDTRTYSLLLSILGENFLAKNNPDSAAWYFREALQYQHGVNSIYDLPKTYNGLGWLYFKKKDFHESAQTFEKAISECDKIGVSYEKVESLKGLSECAYNLGDYKKAVDYYRKSSALYDSLFNAEVQAKISNFENIYKFEKKENELILLTKEKQIQDQKITSLIIILLITIIFVIILILLSLLLYRNRTKLKRQSEELRIANQTKDKLFSIIAHDLRNQIGVILSSSEVLTDDDKIIPEKLKNDFARSIKNEANNTYILLENLLSWAQNQENNIELTPEEYFISRVIEENLNLLSTKAKNKSIELISEVKYGLKLFFDVNTITMVIRNLLINAIKFTKEGGRIVVTSGEEQDFVSIHVTDNGVGMDEETLTKLLKRDSNITKKGTAGEKGIGLGLQICRDFVEKNGGKLMVKSELGKGTEIIFTLPRNK
jgi:signal transduction histidine kinase